MSATQFFEYATMTWPEVRALPRGTPLVIPLGEGYQTRALAALLGEPARAGWLPPVPYGWPRSGLEVEAGLLHAYLANLLTGLREDGFERVYVLAPRDIDLDLGQAQLELDCRARADRLPPEGVAGKVVLIPIGHTEQHGLHLPLSTDTLIIEAISREVAARAPTLAVTLPVMPYGVSTHRASFPGTLNAGGRAFEDFYLAVVDRLVARGFDRFYLLSGHGGNCSFLVNVVKYAGERHRRIFCATTWLYLSGPQGARALQARRRSALGGMGHAGELETALMLHLGPDLVRGERAVDEVDFIATPNFYMDWIEGGAVIANPPWDDDTVTGAYGAGSLATAQNGAFWFEEAVGEKLEHVREIHMQQERREARRRQGYGLWGQRADRPS